MKMVKNNKKWQVAYCHAGYTRCDSHHAPTLSDRRPMRRKIRITCLKTMTGRLPASWRPSWPHDQDSSSSGHDTQTIRLMTPSSRKKGDGQQFYFTTFSISLSQFAPLSEWNFPYKYNTWNKGTILF